MNEREGEAAPLIALRRRRGYYVTPLQGNLIHGGRAGVGATPS